MRHCGRFQLASGFGIRSSIGFVVGGVSGPDTPSVSPMRDPCWGSISPPMTDLLNFLFGSYHRKEAMHTYYYV